MKLFPVAACAAAAFLAACSTTPPATPAAAVQPAPAVSPATAQARPATTTAARPEYLDPQSDIARRRTVYFGFDDSAVRAQDRSVVELQGRYLAAHPNVSVRVEGNTDERGSAEYNLALGQRRAQSVVNALRLVGAKDSQLEAVSWGKEKPVVDGHDEAAWSQNRRAEVVYPAK